MMISYFKRFRMEIDLADPFLSTQPPSGYYLVPWNESLLEAHAEVKFGCFAEEMDATVFPSLGNRAGCTYLMTEIRRKQGFLPAATWLISGPTGYCGTVQGIRDRVPMMGAIQNLGVLPAQRGLGLGTALLLAALNGFRQQGLARAHLEVTAQNDGAIRLYRRIGFRCRKTVYKAVDSSKSDPWAEVSRR